MGGGDGSRGYTHTPPFQSGEMHDYRISDEARGHAPTRRELGKYEM